MPQGVVRNDECLNTYSLLNNLVDAPAQAGAFFLVLEFDVLNQREGTEL